ncbi:MAG: GNAT family N-acetyltransferase [Flavobacteriaceae bacterium]|nr:GNAT family N-acetyltransferase [Flavobacteriaceae bacterium]|tara:strand:- start:74108 stop:74590 length:483 start_codon:yes stop_codon:yes gene_type:complete
MDFTVRFGTEKDVPALLRLIKELALFEKEPEAVEIDEETLLTHGFSEDPKFRFFVAEQDDEIVGIALFYERFSTWKGPVIHLEDLIVTQSRRKLGIGKALYGKVLQYAYTNNYKRVAWEVLDWNQNAIDFYQSSGANYLHDWSVVQMDEEGLSNFVNQNI